MTSSSSALTWGPSVLMPEPWGMFSIPTTAVGLWRPDWSKVIIMTMRIGGHLGLGFAFIYRTQPHKMQMIQSLKFKVIFVNFVLLRLCGEQVPIKMTSAIFLVMIQTWIWFAQWNWATSSMSRSLLTIMEATKFEIRAPASGKGHSTTLLCEGNQGENTNFSTKTFIKALIWSWAQNPLI